MGVVNSSRVLSSPTRESVLIRIGCSTPSTSTNSNVWDLGAEDPDDGVLDRAKDGEGGRLLGRGAIEGPATARVAHRWDLRGFFMVNSGGDGG